jgi:general secretion pathway protein K
MSTRNEKGAALITVLLLVVVMSALAVSLLDDIRFALRRSANAESVGQAQWYALGAEELAQLRIERLMQGTGRTTLAGGWNGEWRDFPIDNGLIRAKISDATACFNLNSVVEGAHEQWTRRPLGLAQFAALLEEFDVPQGEAQSLAEALADWIDSDGARGVAGAEDDVYQGLARPYRTSGALLAEVSELRALRGMTPELYARLRPHVCALPTADLSPVNLNTLGEGDAVVLAALTEGALRPEQARALLQARPEEGWRDTTAFWTLPAFEALSLPDAVLQQVTVRTRFFALETAIAYADAEILASTLFEASPGGGVERHGRRWTWDE